MLMSFIGTAFKLKAGAIEEEAAELGIKPAALHMFLDVESRGCGFQPNGRPIILFEAHVFGKLTKHVYDQSHPNISAPSWDRSLYGAGGDHQFDRLDQAVELDRKAALMSASWGLGQVLGTNFAMVGYDTVEDFVAAMMRSERDQIDAMTEYLKAAGLLRYLMNSPPNYRELARGYNGPGQVDHYASLLRTAYEKWANHAEVIAATPPTPKPATPVPLMPRRAVRPTPPVLSRATHPPDWHDNDNSAEALNKRELDRLNRIGAEVYAR